jgi:hypothetical protein
VSNSSTTSFLVVGLYLGAEDDYVDPDSIDWAYPEQIETLKTYWTDEAIEKFREQRADSDYVDWYDLFDSGHILKEDDDDGEEFIGIGFDMKDDETWGEIKERAKASLAKYIKAPGLINLHYGCRYNG